jgi:hypothetical protein
MKKSVYTMLSAFVIAAAPLAGPTMAAQTDLSGIRLAQSSSQVPAKCAQLQNAQARADCIKKERGGK